MMAPVTRSFAFAKKATGVRTSLPGGAGVFSLSEVAGRPGAGECGGEPFEVSDGEVAVQEWTPTVRSGRAARGLAAEPQQLATEDVRGVVHNERTENTILRFI